MSRLLAFLLIIGATIASGCDDDQDNTISATDFVGAWIVTEFDNTYRQTGTFGSEPIDVSGRSDISDSDLQLNFTEDGTWTSSGAFTATVTTDSDRQVTTQRSLGSGTWSYRQDTLFVSGLRTYNETGFFLDPQPLALETFERDRLVDLTTSMDVTEANAEFEIDIRTRADFEIQLTR